MMLYWQCTWSTETFPAIFPMISFISQPYSTLSCSKNSVNPWHKKSTPLQDAWPRLYSGSQEALPFICMSDQDGNHVQHMYKYMHVYENRNIWECIIHVVCIWECHLQNRAFHVKRWNNGPLWRHSWGTFLRHFVTNLYCCLWKMRKLWLYVTRLVYIEFQ